MNKINQIISEEIEQLTNNSPEQDQKLLADAIYRLGDENVLKIAGNTLPSVTSTEQLNDRINTNINRRLSIDDFPEEGGYDYDGYDMAWNLEYQNVIYDLCKEITRELLK